MPTRVDTRFRMIIGESEDGAGLRPHHCLSFEKPVLYVERRSKRGNVKQRKGREYRGRVRQGFFFLVSGGRIKHTRVLRDSITERRDVKAALRPMKHERNRAERQRNKETKKAALS